MDKADLDARFRQLLVIWGAQLGGVTVFAGITYALGSGLLGAFSPTLDPGLAAKLLLLSPALMVGGIVFRRGEVQARALEPEARLSRYFIRVIAATGAVEGGGLLGLVLAWLSGQTLWSVGVWALTMVALLLCRPSRDEAEQLLR